MKKHALLCRTNSLNSRQRWDTIIATSDVGVLYCSDLELSLRPYEPEDFDLVVVEAFGVSDDIDLCNRLRQRFDCPILLFAQNDAEDFAVAAYQAGIDECISGYISSDLLQAKVNAWLRWLDRKHSRPGARISWARENSQFNRIEKDRIEKERRH